VLSDSLEAVSLLTALPLHDFGRSGIPVVEFGCNLREDAYVIARCATRFQTNVAAIKSSSVADESCLALFKSTKISRKCLSSFSPLRHFASSFRERSALLSTLPRAAGMADKSSSCEVSGCGDLICVGGVSGCGANAGGGISGADGRGEVRGAASGFSPGVSQSWGAGLVWGMFPPSVSYVMGRVAPGIPSPELEPLSVYMSNSGSSNSVRSLAEELEHTVATRSSVSGGIRILNEVIVILEGK